MSLCEKLSSVFCQKEKPVYELPDSKESVNINIQRMIKILVLGPGDSGKSTILKQMRVIHGDNYSDDERKKYIPVIIQNIIDSIIRLVEAMDLFSLEFENGSNERDYKSILKCQEKLKLGDMTDWEQNSNIYGDIIKSIWDDPSIKTCYQKRNMFYLNDSAEYFVENLKRICSSEYVPKIDDVLRVRQPTTGTYFLFVDVGGQRSERRKWINCFDNVSSILFVASLSDYDLSLSKDEMRLGNSEDANRMREALNLFTTVINYKTKVYSKTNNYEQKPVEKETLFFENKSIILFLNKEDLFEKKFSRSPLKACFPDFNESNNSTSEKAKDFIAHKFIECDKTRKNKNKRDIYWHYTYALDRNCIESVVAMVRERITKQMLDVMNLL